MKRGVEDVPLLIRFAEDFSAVVGNHARYIIVSGFVSMLHGRSRSTEDIDMIIERIPKERFVALHRDLEQAGFRCVQRERAEELFEGYLLEKTSIRYARKDAVLPELELKMSRDALDDEQLKKRVRLPLTGTALYFSSPEANIAFKEELLRSPKDIDDARTLRYVYEQKLDGQEIKRFKAMIRRLRLQ